MKVILDTNVLLVSISEKSKLHFVFKSLVKKQNIDFPKVRVIDTAEFRRILKQ